MAGVFPIGISGGPGKFIPRERADRLGSGVLFSDTGGAAPRAAGCAEGEGKFVLMSALHPSVVSTEWGPLSGDGPVLGAIRGERAEAATDASCRRTLLLVLAASLMGLADLACTLTYMRGIGMFEINPIARWMIEIGGARQLILFKLFTIALSAGTLFLCRRYRGTEKFAWMCAIIMLVLTIQWMYYNAAAPTLTHEFAVIAMGEAPEMWVTLKD